MKQTRYLTIPVIVILFLSLILSGCGKTVQASLQEITVNLGDEPATLDPQLVYDVIPMRVINAVFEGLCRKDQNGRPIPGAADFWNISEDKLTYTFHIRNDATWWDGSKVTAADFKKAWLRALNPQPENHEPSYMGSLLFCIKGAMEYASGQGKEEDVGVEAKDDNTLVVTLVKPAPYFLDLVCSSVFMPVNEGFFNNQPEENGVTTYGSEAWNIIGNGPFLIKDWKHDDSIVLVKNSKYWNASNIKVDKIVFKMIKDNSSAFTSFKAGEIDVVDITEQSNRLQTDKKKNTIKSYDVGVTQYISFNNEDPLLKNENIRKALSYAIDRETLTQKVLYDGSKKALGFVNPVISGIDGTFRDEAGDLFKDNDLYNAKLLFAKGLAELKLNKMPEISLLIDDKETSRRDAQAIQEMWRKKLGLEVEIEAMPFDAMTEKMMGKDYQMALLMWSADFNDPTAFLDVFRSENFFNVAFYNNTDFDSLLEKANLETDENKRMKMLIEAEKMVIEDMAVCPVYFLCQNYAVSNKIKGFVRGNSAIQDFDFYWTYIDE